MLKGTGSEGAESSGKAQYTEQVDSDEERTRNTELFGAIRESNLNKVKSLLEDGVKTDIIDRNNKDNSPLHYTVEKNKKEIVEELLRPKWKTNINAQNDKGDTPLHIAVSRGNKELIQLLLNNQAEVGVKNNNNEVPLDIAKRLDMQDIAQILGSHIQSSQQAYVGKQLASQQQPRQNLLDTSCFDNFTFSKRAGTSTGDHGRKYEKKLFMLYLLYGLSGESDFALTSNEKDFEASDDIVFRYKDQREANKLKIVFIQAKHRENPCPSDNITFEDLFIDGDDRKQQKKDFQLNKYFKSYLKIKQHTEYKDSDITFVIHTNVDVNLKKDTKKQSSVETLEKYLEELKSTDDNILNIYKGQKGKLYRIENRTELKKYFSCSSDDEIEDFLLRLRFAVKQPNQSELDNIIKEDIRNKYKISEKKDIDMVFSFVYGKTEGWWVKQGRKVPGLTRKDDYFKEAIEHLYSLKPKENLPKHWQVPPKNDNFVGRGTQLNNIKKSLGTNNIATLVACHGLGGVGKTQLALELVWSESQAQKYTGIIWFDTKDRNTLTNEYIKLGRELNIIRGDEKEISEEDCAKRVRHWLEDPKRTGWLLICDNAPNYEDIADLLPTKGGEMLLTSRYKFGWPQPENNIFVDVFKTEESRNYICKILKVEGQELNITEVNKLAETLGHLPLALAQASAYIKKTGINISEYLNLYNDRKRALLSDKTLLETFPAGANRDTAAIVYVTWDITVEAIKKESLLASNWLNVCAYLNNHGIPNNLLEIFANNPKNNPDSETFYSARGILKSYSMLTLNQGDNSASIHNVLQEVIRLKLDEETKEGEILEKTLVLFDNIDLTNIDHAMSVWNYASKYDELVKKFTKLPRNIMGILNSNVRYEEACLFGNKLSKSLNDMLGSDHPDTLCVRNNIASVLYNRGKYNEALQVFREVLNKRKAVLNPNHPDILGTNAGIARALNKMDKCEEALKIFKEVCRIQEKTLGPKHLYTLGTKTAMAGVLGNQDKYEEAYEILNEVYKNREEILGSSNFETLTTLNNMAEVLAKQGKYDDALQEYQKVLDKCAWPLEANDHLISIVQNNMAIVLDEKGEHEEALQIFLEVHKERKKVLGVDHPDTLTSWCSIGLALLHQGKYKEALEVLRDVYKKSEEILGANHRNTLATRNIIASVLIEQGEYENALQELRVTYSTQENTLGASHRETLTTLHNIAEALGNLGKYEEALQELRLIYSAQKSTLEAGHPGILTTLGGMAEMLAKQGKYDEALQLLRDIGDKGTKTLGTCRVLTIKHNIATILHNQGNDSALQAFQETYDERKKILGPKHPDTLVTRRDMAIALGQGKCKEASQILQEVLNAQEDILGPDHPDTLTTQDNKAFILATQRKYDEALKNYIEVLEKREKKLGSNHPSTLKTRSSIDAVLYKQGKNWTILHLAASYGSAEKVECLLKSKKYNINAVTRDSFILLHLAVENNNAKTTSALIKYFKSKNPKQLNSFINSQANLRKTSLHIAAQNGNREVVEILLKNGAHYNAKDVKKKTPLGLAKSGSDVESLLKDINGLFKAIQDNDKDEIDLLLTRKDSNTLEAILNARNNKDKTLIQVALARGNKDIAELLVRRLKNNIHKVSQPESGLPEASGKADSKPETCLSNVAISKESTKTRLPGSER